MHLPVMRVVLHFQSGTDHDTGESEGTWHVHSSVIFEYGNLLDSGISAGNDPESETGKPDKFYCAGLYSANVDELSSPYTGMADIA